MRFADQCILLLFTFHTASQLFWNFVHYLTKSSLWFLEGALKRTMRESTEELKNRRDILHPLSLTVNLYQMCEAMEVIIWSAPVYTQTYASGSMLIFLQHYISFSYRTGSAKKLQGVFVKIFLTPAPACEHVAECPACCQLLNLLVRFFKRQKMRTGNQPYTFHSLKN